MVMWVALLAAMAVLPFVLTMVTSFAKLVVVGGLLRQALGTPQIPPNSVLTGLAMILTVHIMWPVGTEVWQNYQQNKAAAQAAQAVPVFGADPVNPAPAVAADPDAAKPDAPKPDPVQPDPANPNANPDAQAKSQNVVSPWDDPDLRLWLQSIEPAVRKFLVRHSHPDNVALFTGLQEKLQDKPLEFNQQNVGDRLIELITVLAPAFMLSELTEAFQIAFLLFVPFVVIDLLVSNVLLSMGMHMLTPTTISLPLKLLLFVLIDGWQLVVQGLVVGYT